MNLIKKMMLTRGLPVLNTPNENCEDKCEEAKKATLFLANQLNDEINVENIMVMCLKCGNSFWKIKQRKETMPQIEEIKNNEDNKK